MMISKLRNQTWFKGMSLFLALSFLNEMIFPNVAMALTSGPAQPEFSSFEPVATTNMVNTFTGDLTYNLPVLNIPGPDGGGYAMSLSYHSGTSPEEEASWVGYGWTLNPGAINRGKRGFPDDWNNKPIKYHSKSKKNKTVTVGGSIGAPEVFSFDIGVNANASIRYNNYVGFGYSAGAGISLGGGVVSLGYNVSNGQGSFSLGVNPAANLNKNKEETDKAENEPKTKSAKTTETKAQKKKTRKANRAKQRAAQQKKRDEGQKGQKKFLGSVFGQASSYGIRMLATQNYNLNNTEYTGKSYTLGVGVLATPAFLPAGFSAGLSGTYSTQENTAQSTLEGYGYMYASEGASRDDAMHDYYVEKGSTYNKRDKFLGIPFNNADNFNLSGEAIGGSFRAYQHEIGHYHPNKVDSKTEFFDLGVEIELPTNVGGGADLGYGQHNLTVEEWTPLSTFSQEGDEDQDEPHIFRFKNDLGGNIFYDTDESAERAVLNYTSTVPGDKSVSANVNHIGKIRNNGERVQRSSYVGYTLNSDMNKTEGSKHYRAYEKQAEVYSHVNRAESVIGEQIGEFSVVNEEGQRYNYGLPVYSRNEKNISIDLKGLSGSNISDNYLAFKNSTGSVQAKVGEERDAPYAAAHLLTSIVGPNYVDRTHDGPTNDDFGSWTKFIYKRKYGSTNKESGGNWFKWRMPYNGLLYNRNSISDGDDDMGSYSSGEKEVYYLDTVKTKTHIAVFRRSNRNDGYDAAAESSASSSSSAKGTNQLERLDRIDLYSVNQGSYKLIKSVRFEYEPGTAQLSKGVPNALNNSTGKLTLKKVWFEYEGVYNARISPYIFNYEYSTANYPSPYNANWASDPENNMNQYGSSFTENPNYSAFNLDAWGNFQHNGANRFAKMRNWVNQNPNSSVFDPAAWQLKNIKLPSGGEIHIQYEQDDYAYVQDKLAHAMVKLKAPSNDGTAKYYLETSDINVSTTAEKTELKQLIYKEYILPKRKIYFKFFYKLIGGSTPQITDCSSDYITGYANVKNVGIDGNGVWVTLGGGGKHDLPAKVCRDFVKTQRAGKLSLVGNCDPSEDGVSGSNPTEIIENFLGFAISFSYPSATCAAVNWDLSYLRVPVVNPKLGGGIRVKRLLTYDPGMDTGYPSLYGSEYRYEVWDQNRGKYISSGVATNEPASIREENVLTKFLERFKQGWIDKAISGRDKKQAEGPIGESIMPGASVGYSRVITQNIHTGKTNTGFSVQEFYTNKDYPYTYAMTTIDDSHKDYLPIPGGLVNIFTNNAWLSQGFAFYQNNMHGQSKSTIGYGGVYDPTDPYQTNSVQVSVTEQVYFEPGEDIPVMYSYGNYGMEPLGQEMDISFESRHVRDRNDNGALEFDVDVSLLLIPIPMGSAFPSYTYSNSEIYTHATSKLVTYPVVLKETRNYQDGIYHVSKNKYFDPATGKPVVTETYDDFNGISIMSNLHDGKYTGYDLKAYTKYNQMSQKSQNEKKVIHNMDGGIEVRRIIDGGEHYLSFNDTTGSGNVCDLLGSFGVGDLVVLNGADGATTPTDEVYHVGDVSAKGLALWKLSYGTYTTTNSVVDIEILHSGKTNQLTASVGGFTTYGQPSVVHTPIDPSITGPRAAFVSLMNNLLNGSITEITSAMMPNDPTTTSGKLEIVYNGVDCAPLPTDHVIRVEGNEIRVYKQIEEGEGCDTTIIGSPSSPHPLVNALNNYFTTYSQYNLGSPSSYANFQCREVDPVYTTSLYEVPNVDPAVAGMRAAQTADLAQMFANVNGGTYALNTFFEDDGFALGKTSAGYKDVTFPPSMYINQRVVLRYIPQNIFFGLETTCQNGLPTYSEGCSDRSAYFTNQYSMHNNWDLAAGRGLNYTNFYQTADGYLGIGYEADDCLTGLRFYECKSELTIDSLVCNYGLFMSGGQGNFQLDPQTASIVYYTSDNACIPQNIECINFCGESYPKTTITRVVSSSANCFADQWDYNDDLYAELPLTSNPYNAIETGRRNKWRASNTYAYREMTSKGKNYESGLYGMELYNYEIQQANNPNLWLNATSVTAYSPNGNAVEEENILGIKSAAKFGYDHTLPYAIAQNSDYNSMFFESFENRYEFGGNKYFEDGFLEDANTGTWESILSNSEAHTGLYSFKLKRDYEGIRIMNVKANSDATSQGLLAKVWLKTDMVNTDIIETDEVLKLQQRNPSSMLVTSTVSFTKVAQSGDWILYEAKLPAASVVDGDDLYLLYEYTKYGTEQVWIDDIRVQPLSSSMTAYVYDDATQRLIASFDDQHFGLLYQYNHEGKLVRKLMETERGVKTIQETQYNTQEKLNR